MKTKKLLTALISVLMLSLIIPQSYAQEAESLLNKAKIYLEPSRGLKIDYQLQIGDGQPTTGCYYALNKAFYLESEELKAWHDGKGNLWVFLSQNGEVNLTNPLEEDLMELNPLLNLSILSAKRFYLNTKTKGAITTLTATPKSPKEEPVIERLELQIDTKGKPIIMKVKQRGIQEVLSVKVVKLTQGIAKEMKQKDFFTFTPNKLPNVSVIDLR